VKKSLKTVLRKLAMHTPYSVYKMMLRRKLVGLYYHVVSNKPLPHIQHLYSYKTPEAFEADLIFLKSNYDILPYEQIRGQLSLNKTTRPNSVFLSFDDGYAECFSIVRPLLLKHDIPCTFFITTDFIDNNTMYYENVSSLCINRVKLIDSFQLGELYRKMNDRFGTSIDGTESFVQWILSLGVFESDELDAVCDILDVDTEKYLRDHRPYLTSDEIKRLASDGFTIGAHGKSHARLSVLNNDGMETEIVYSCNIISSLTGRDDVPFAFPYSGDGLDRDFLENVISKYRFINLFFNTGSLRRDRGFIVNRICADKPPFNKDRTSTISHLIRTAYVNQVKSRFSTVAKSLG
jgi:peptidoglycan/xylan/chitin deacetylase (PgdA/CDA1 family)